MSEPRVSVVMSAYSPRYIRLALDSILAQTFTDFEFVIVDDSASAEMRALLGEYIERDSRIVVARNARNMGQTWSLNHGFGLARGELIARQDDDDISDPERLGRQAAFLEANPEIGLVGTQARIIDGEGRVQQQTTFPTTPGEVRSALLRDCVFIHGSVMVRHSWLRAVGDFDATLQPSEDYDLWLRLAEVTQLANLPEALYAFRIHTSSQSHRRRHTQMFNKALALERALERRHGAQAPAAQQANAARDYLEAAVASALNNEAEFGRRSLARALSLRPALLDRAEPLQGILDEYTAGQDAASGAVLVETVYGWLPDRSARLRRRQRRYVAGLHMRDVFRGLRERRPEGIRRDLWLGIRHDPRWLLNRGVLVTALRTLAGRR